MNASELERKDVIEIAEGLRLIEEGVERIQKVMRDRKIKSIQEIASSLIPIFKQDEDQLSEEVLKHLQ